MARSFRPFYHPSYPRFLHPFSHYGSTTRPASTASTRRAAIGRCARLLFNSLPNAAGLRTVLGGPRPHRQIDGRRRRRRLNGRRPIRRRASCRSGSRARGARTAVAALFSRDGHLPSQHVEDDQIRLQLLVSGGCDRGCRQHGHRHGRLARTKCVRGDARRGGPAERVSEAARISATVGACAHLSRGRREEARCWSRRCRAHADNPIRLG